MSRCNVLLCFVVMFMFHFVMLLCVVIMLLCYVVGVLLCRHVIVLSLCYCYICSTAVIDVTAVAIGDARGH